MTRERMTVVPLTTPEQLSALTPWLQSFDHKPAEPIGRYHLFSRMDRILGLSQQLLLNVLIPAVNPNTSTPRETAEIVNCFHNWNANTTGGLLVAVPSKSHMHEHMASLGYKAKAVLYESITPISTT